MKQDLILKLLELLLASPETANNVSPETANNASPETAALKVTPHPMLGRRCLVRTYSAGVHIGDVAYVNPQNSMEIKLENSLRLWSWKEGGLSLSAIANDGVKSARLNTTGEVFLTNVIEFIPTTEAAEKTYVTFIEK